jgi:hypothetical protein
LNLELRARRITPEEHQRFKAEIAQPFEPKFLEETHLKIIRPSSSQL